MCLTKGLDTWLNFSINPRSYWMLSGASLLLFSIFNCVLYLLLTSSIKYWFKSTLSYVLLMIILTMAATFFSGFGIDEAGSYRWIFMVLTLGYLIIISIVQIIRKLVEFAQKDDERKFE
ncbi:MAG: hypothetical protein ABIV51_10095 [Saprospiraceae bacterium]